MEKTPIKSLGAPDFSSRQESQELASGIHFCNCRSFGTASSLFGFGILNSELLFNDCGGVLHFARVDIT
jgi:hypothetical protein